ncbi:MAG: alpha/beta hydrolase [Pseudomonadota bacterium]
MPFLKLEDVDLYYESFGAGEPILFAHGAGGNAAIWFNQLAYFSKRYRCISFDHRGFARSRINADGDPDHLRVQQFRDDALALLDHLDIEQAHLVGQSMGGFTVLRTTLDAPQRVKTLTFSATSGGIYNPNPTPAVAKLTDSGDDSAGGVLATMSAASKTKPELMQLYESINNLNTEFSWARLATLLGKDDVVAHGTLRQIACKVLFIAGAEDPLFPPEQLAGMVPHFANASIEVVNDSGHSPYFEQASVFNHLLEKHISDA